MTGVFGVAPAGWRSLGDTDKRARSTGLPDSGRPARSLFLHGYSGEWQTPTLPIRGGGARG